MNYVKEQIDLAWSKVFGEEKELDFIESFHSINEERALAYIKRKIDQIELEKYCLLDFDFDSKKNNHTIHSDLIRVLGDFKYSENYEIALDLILLYFNKKQTNVMDIYFIFTNYLGFDKYSHNYEYEYELKNIEGIWKASDNGLNINETLLLLHIINKYLDYEFEYIEKGQGHTITFITSGLLMCEGLINLRKSMWNILGLLYHNPIYKSYVEKVLLDYYYYPDSDKNLCIFVEDLKLIENAFFNKDELPNIPLSKFMVKLIKTCKRKNVDIPEYLYQYRFNKDFIIYNTLTDYEITEDFEKEQDVRKVNIYNLVKEYNIEEFEYLFNLCKTLQNNYHKDDWELITGINLIFEVLKHNNSQYIEAVKAYLNCNTPYCNHATDILEVLISKTGLAETERIISTYNYEAKNRWILEFIDLIPENEINGHHIKLIYNAIDEEKGKENPQIPNITNLYKYNKLDGNIVNYITKIVIDKAKSTPFIVRNFIGQAYDDKHANLLLEIYSADLVLLEELYALGIRYDDFIDYSGFLFKKLIHNNKVFLKKILVENINNLSDSLMHIIRKIWEVNDFEELVNISYETIMNNLEVDEIYFEDYRLKRLFVSHSDKTIIEIIKKRQKQWIKNYISKTYTDRDKLKIIFEIVSNVFKNDRIEFILFFVDLNNDISIFNGLSLFPTHYSWSGSQVPYIEKDIQFLLELYEKINGIKYIEHRSYIKEKILALEKYKKDILVREYLEDFDYA